MKIITTDDSDVVIIELSSGNRFRVHEFNPVCLKLEGNFDIAVSEINNHDRVWSKGKFIEISHVKD